MNMNSETNRPGSGVNSPNPNRNETTVIGPTVVITGDLVTEEDLLLQGTVEGTIIARGDQVTIQNGGRIVGNTIGKTIRVEGLVEGDLYGEDRIAVISTGDIHGNLFAPRVSLDEGCRVKGKVSMEDTQARVVAVEAIIKKRRTGKQE